MIKIRNISDTSLTCTHIHTQDLVASLQKSEYLATLDSNSYMVNKADKSWRHCP